MTPFGAPVARPIRGVWLTPAAVIERLHVCRATVYKLCQEGRLGFSRVGLGIRIAEWQLEAHMSLGGGV